MPAVSPELRRSTSDTPRFRRRARNLIDRSGDVHPRARARLAETLGDPFRHLSSKKLKSWKIERYSVHGVLVFALVMTAIVLVNYLSARGGNPLLGDLTWRVQKWYGFLISSIFAGVVGTGFYNTIKETKGLRGAFANAEQRVFDVYEVGGRIGNVFVQGFRSMHNGVLSTYLAWSVIGLGAIVFALLSVLLRQLVGGN